MNELSPELMRARFFGQIGAEARDVIARIVNASAAGVWVAGGAVRDLMLGRTVAEVDLVTEEDAIEVVGRALPTARVAAHSRFRTAGFSAGRTRVDVATARAEMYARPGALPSVRTGVRIEEDLRRRDFSVNAMALRLTGEAALVDPCGGAGDIDGQLVRALHGRSFVDDPTRIFRALRYAARLGFAIEPETMGWMREGLAYVGALSGTRVRRELELMLLDTPAGMALEQADAMGLLAAVHRALGWPSPPGPLSHQGSGGATAEETGVEALPFGFAVMACRATMDEAEEIVERVRLRRREAEAVRGLAAMSQVAAMLRRPQAKPSGVVMVLDRYPAASVAAFAYTTADEIAAGVARTYLAEWRHVKPLLRGDDLIALGVPEGPQVQKGLSLIRASRLDGWSGDEGDERALALRYAKSIRDSAAANSMIELRLDGSNKGYRDDN